MENIIKGKNVIVKNNVILGKNVILEDNVYVDSNTIIRDYVHVRKNTYIGSNCILGEYTGDFFEDHIQRENWLNIGESAIIRSGTIIYSGCNIGDYFQTGHRVTIRENTDIGNYTRVGTLTDIQFECRIGNYVSLHSNVFLGEKTEIDDFVWLFPGVTVTNDPTPPSMTLKPVKVNKYASIAAKSIILPGVIIGESALVGAGSIVTKDVKENTVVLGNPAKEKGSIFEIKDKESNQPCYPWQEHFDRGMPWKEIGYKRWKEENSIKK